MADLSKVIKGLECHIGRQCITNAMPKEVCPYWEDDRCDDALMTDALELLKEQAGVPYVYDSDGETACGVCGCHFDKAYSHCPKCGKKVNWNA